MHIYSNRTKKSQAILGQRFIEPSPENLRTRDLFKTLMAERLADRTGEKTDLVLIGKVTKNLPTVSDLLYSTTYKEVCWDILAKELNAGKAFKFIPVGTEIFFNPETSELSWEGSDQKKRTMARSDKIKSDSRLRKNETLCPVRSDSHGADSLSAAARQFLGTDYSKMDCYELVVGGLKGMGIQYQGKGGLGKHLMKKAVNRGFAYNHYLNGEGIMDAAGTNPYQKSIFKIKNADIEADKVMAEMVPFLRDGQILSFSTRSRGHTGIVSKKGKVWTFINSGDMDHNLAGSNGKMGVGEEVLAAEIKNWFRLASKNGEGLKLSLGTLDMKKIAKFCSKRDGFTEKV